MAASDAGAMEEEQYADMYDLMTDLGDDGLTLAQLAMYFVELPDPPPMAQVEEIFSQCDEDEDGLIDGDEFINVVEIVKLLKNKTTPEIFDSFKAAKYLDVFRRAAVPPSGNPNNAAAVAAQDSSAPPPPLPVAEVEVLLSFFVEQDDDDLVSDAGPPPTGSSPIAEILAPHADAQDMITAAAFKDVVTSLADGRGAVEVVDCFARGLQALTEHREARAKGGKTGLPGQGVSALGIYVPDSDDEENGVPGCAGCERLQSRLRHSKLELEAEKLLVREQKVEIEELTRRLHALENAGFGGVGGLSPKASMRSMKVDNTSFNVKEMSRMSSRYSQSHAGDGHPPPPASVIDANTEEMLDRERQKRERVEREKKMLTKELKEREMELKSANADVASLKKRLGKVKQENVRHTSALALLHKHIANLEKDNEVLKRGGHNDHIREILEKEKMLKAKLETSEKRIEELQQENWYQDKLDYLQRQKHGGMKVKQQYANPQLFGSATPSPQAQQLTPPQQHHHHHAGGRLGSGLGNPVNRTSSQGGGIPPPLPQQSPGGGGPAGVTSPITTCEPSDGEYKTLSNYYLLYQNAKSVYEADRVLEKCCAELQRTTTHHPAYWSAKDCARIRMWMKNPSMPDGIVSDVQRKRYVHSPSRVYSTTAASTVGPASTAAPSPQMRVSLTPPPQVVSPPSTASSTLRATDPIARRVLTHDPRSVSPHRPHPASGRPAGN